MPIRLECICAASPKEIDEMSPLARMAALKHVLLNPNGKCSDCNRPLFKILNEMYGRAD